MNETTTDRIFQVGNGDRISHARRNAITVLRNGNTGIGTTAPDFPLNFSNNLGDKISLYGNSGAHYGFGIQGSLLQVHSAGSTDDIGFGFDSSSSFTERARIINNGEIRMEVTGRLRLKTGTESAGVWFMNAANSARAFVGLQTDSTVGLYGQTGAAGWRFFVNTSSGDAYLQGTLTQNSDSRLKKNISRLVNALPNIKNISGYQYQWKDETRGNDLQVGLLAQEVQNIYPHLVKQNEKGELSVNYIGLIPVLLEGIKTLNEKLEQHQKQIDDLKNKKE